jgi:ABC-type sugar transport system substrate-binding protein
MKKAALLSTLVVAVLLAVGVMAQAQQQTKQPRIGFLFIGSKDQPHMEKFR